MSPLPIEVNTDISRAFGVRVVITYEGSVVDPTPIVQEINLTARDARGFAVKLLMAADKLEDELRAVGVVL